MSALQNLAQLTSLQIVNCFVLGVVVAALAGVLSVLARRRSSGIRFAIWFAALVAIASLFFSRSIAHGAAVHASAPEIALRPEWAVYIFGVWALLASIGLARVARGLWRVRSLKTACTPLDPSLAIGLQNALPKMWRRVRVCTSDRLRVPAALGFFRPVIALPSWSVRELSSEELATVVLHEAAHLQRWDDWTNLLQKVVRALLFFHPAVWLIDSRLSVEREMSCDDMVLAGSRSPRQYAACLISLAEKTHAHHSLALVQAAVGQLKHTARRISKILDGQQRVSTPMLKPAVAAAAVFGALSFVAVQHAPQFVSFDSRSSSLSRSSADGFDYVANVNGPRARAIAASLPASRTVHARPVNANLPLRRPAAKRNVNLKPVPQTEEARKQFDWRYAKGTSAVINAGMSADAIPSFVYLVTQTEQYDGFGNVTITTSVWRIRAMKPAPRQAQSPVLPNRT